MESAGARVVISRLSSKALHESFERSAAVGARRADAPEVVDAAVLLQHVDQELLRHAVELADQLRAQRGATVEDLLLLRLQLALGELQEQMLGERRQRHVVAVDTATAVERHGGRR